MHVRRRLLLQQRTCSQVKGGGVELQPGRHCKESEGGFPVGNRGLVCCVMWASRQLVQQQRHITSGSTGASNFCVCVQARARPPTLCVVCVCIIAPGLPANASLFGGLAVAVPGELQGLEAAWKRFGSKPWAQLVKPAADLARAGFAAHPYLVYIMSGEANLKRMKVGCLCVVCKFAATWVGSNCWARCLRTEHPRLQS